MSIDVIKDTDSTSLISNGYQKQLGEWIHDEKAAIEFIYIAGELWFNKSVELILYRNQLIDRSASEILKLHQYAKEIVNQPINIQDTLTIARELHQLDLAPSRIDIGKLNFEWIKEQSGYATIADFLSGKLQKHIGTDKLQLKPKDVVLFGFGRIGRIIARELITQAGKGEQLRLKAIVTRDHSAEDIRKRADLLRNDSVHGSFPGTIIEDFENRALIINGHTIHMISANKPQEIDYEKYGIHEALLIDNTGISRDREGLSKHLLAKGIDKVLLTAPGKGDIPNIVHGINHKNYKPDERIFSAASCTTNAIVPVLKVVDQTVGIERGHIETIHAYTNDQNLLDNYHNKYRRGRSAALNMVITETGADKAVAKVLPQLEGKLTGNAVRVPVPNVSLAILNITTKEEVSIEKINNILKDAALKGDLVEQIQYMISNELVSSDLVGNPCAPLLTARQQLFQRIKKQWCFTFGMTMNMATVVR